MKLILTVSGKDMSSFMEQWVCQSGVPQFYASVNFIRKKNIVELKLKQNTPKGKTSFVVSQITCTTLCIQLYGIHKDSNTHYSLRLGILQVRAYYKCLEQIAG